METAAARTATAVREAMKAQGVTQQALAYGTDIPMATLHRRLKAVTPFTVTELDAIAAYLGVPMADLMVAAA